MVGVADMAKVSNGVCPDMNMHEFLLAKSVSYFCSNFIYLICFQVLLSFFFFFFYLFIFQIVDLGMYYSLLLCVF